MKKVFGFIIGLALSVGLITTYAAADSNSARVDGEMSPKIIFDIDFNDASLSPNVGAATEGSGKGIYVVSYDGTMAYQFNNSYFKPTAEYGKPLLTGLEEFTVSYWAKMDSAGMGWTLFTAPNTSTQSYQKEKYIGILDSGASVLSERYNNNGSRPANISVKNLANGWKHVVLVQKTDRSELYVNGTLAESVSSSFGISKILGDAPIIQVGKGNWGSGEYSSGIIDNYKIFNYALSTDEIGALYEDEFTPVVEWETAVDSMKTGEEGAEKGTLRFLAAVTGDNGFDISKCEYGFVFVNFEPDFNTNIKYESIAQSGLEINKAYFIDIEDIPLSAAKIGFYAVPYITLENGYVIYGPSFTVNKLNWVSE